MAQPRGRRMPEWERRSFVERNDFTCAYCGAVGGRWGTDDGGPWHVDHVQPVSKGGSLELDNLALACELCNTLKGSVELADLPGELEALAAHVRRMLAGRDGWPVKPTFASDRVSPEVMRGMAVVTGRAPAERAPTRFEDDE